jgi:hypothetical protein
MELGRSVVEHRPAIPPEQMARILAQLRDQNQAIRQELETAPEPRIAPDVDEQGESPGLGEGQGVTSARGADKDSVPIEKIDPITDYLANDQDDEHDWS